MATSRKNLSDRIAERMKQRGRYPAHRNRAVFLALREEIRAALSDGWSIRAVWETLHGEQRIAFGYDAFTAYVNKLIRAPAGTVSSPSVGHPHRTPVRPLDGPVIGASELPSFTHNPHRDPKDVI